MVTVTREEKRPNITCKYWHQKNQSGHKTRLFFIVSGELFGNNPITPEILPPEFLLESESFFSPWEKKSFRVFVGEANLRIGSVGSLFGSWITNHRRQLDIERLPLETIEVGELKAFFVEKKLQDRSRLGPHKKHPEMMNFQERNP